MTCDYVFKATDGSQAIHGGNYRYRRGMWTRTEPVDPCRTGWHVAVGSQVLNWLAPTLWLAEIHPDAEVVDAGDKMVASKIRVVERLDTWNDRTARLFAADCAEAALALVDEPDARSLEAVAVTRRFADGDATRSEWDAARDAAWDAVLDADRAAAWGAAGDAAWYAAGAAAWGAARDAARDAARAAAWDAARDAARDAAWDAARAAGADARDAQYVNLLNYMELEPS